MNTRESGPGNFDATKPGSWPEKTSPKDKNKAAEILSGMWNNTPKELVTNLTADTATRQKADDDRRVAELLGDILSGKNDNVRAINQAIEEQAEYTDGSRPLGEKDFGKAA